MKRIVFVAGDKSGDLYGGMLCEKIRERFPDCELYSLGGPHLARHSRQIIDILQHSVSGICEVIFSLKEIMRIFNLSYAHIERLNPDLIILIDFPDFNLRLAQKINKKYPIFYYISPQVWAWRAKRVEIVRRYVEKMVVIFRFEETFYQNLKIPVLYFGHPLLEIIKPQPVPARDIISFMPGSRRNEISRHLPIMEGIKKIIEEKTDRWRFQIICADNIGEDFYARQKITIPLRRHSYQAMGESKFIVACSGTATVEIAILGIPYVLIYKLNPLSWHLLRRMVKTPYAGMVNILSDRKVIEEFLQDKATPEAIAEKVLSYLTDDRAYRRIQEELQAVQEKLSPYGGIGNFARFIGEYLHLAPAQP